MNKIMKESLYVTLQHFRCTILCKKDKRKRFKNKTWGTWLTKSEEHVTPDLGILGSSLMLGVDYYKKKINLKTKNKT